MSRVSCVELEPLYAYHQDSVIQEYIEPINRGKIHQYLLPAYGPSHKSYGHTGGLTHKSNYMVLCHITAIPTNVEPYCDVVLNIVLEVVPEDDACVKTRWTRNMF
jgi:hypothetical protein